MTAATPASDSALADWIVVQRRLSLAHLLSNVSPTTRVDRAVDRSHVCADRWPGVRPEATIPDACIRLTGNHVHHRIVPHPGSVAAAGPSKPPEPDYYFHWVRDSALAMHTIAQLYSASAPADAALYQQRLAEFMFFSRSLRTSAPAAGLAEVRYNMDGTPDYLKWSRPQNDGPALRALTLMHYRSLRKIPLTADAQSVLLDIVRTDLDHVAAHWDQPGFDLWEEYLGHDFHARVVQLAALREGARFAMAEQDQSRVERYLESAALLDAALVTHWLPAAEYYGFFAGRTVYWDGTERTKPGDNFDTAIVMAALHGRLSDGRYSLLDDRILATAAKAEDLFLRLYAINRSAGDGTLYGRYERDSYFGGNAWVFITLAFAEAHYRIAALLARRTSLELTSLNRPFFERALRRAGVRTSPNAAFDPLADVEPRGALLHGLISRGDDILRTVRRLTPTSGELPEQYDRNSGDATGCRNLTWSHSSFLAATHARTVSMVAVNTIWPSLPG